MIVITDRNGNQTDYDADRFEWSEERYSMLTLAEGGTVVAELNMDQWYAISYQLPYAPRRSEQA